MKAQLLIAAGGMGLRLGFELPKALVTILGKPIVKHTLDRMDGLPFHCQPVIVIPRGYHDLFQNALRGTSAALVEGGEERQESVRKGLLALDKFTEIVVIHDAARPFVSKDKVLQAITEAENWGGATLASPVADTILSVAPDCFLESTPDRRLLWACQTPQVFQKKIIVTAHELAEKEGRTFTDDASLARYYGAKVRIVDGGQDNFKITTRMDFEYAEYLLSRE